MGVERYRVRVKDGEAVAGLLRETGQRVQVMPGEYVVHWLTWIAKNSDGEPRLRFLGAGPEGRDIDVRQEEFPELQQWPPAPSPRFEYLGLVSDAV